MGTVSILQNNTNSIEDSEKRLKSTIEEIANKIQNVDNQIDNIGMKIQRIRERSSPFAAYAHPSTQEAMHGKSDDNVDIEYFERGLKIKRSICRLTILENHKEKFGTGFLIGNGYLLTAAHCLPDDQVNSRIFAKFNYENDREDFDDTQPFEIDVSPIPLIKSDNDLDFAVLKFEPNDLKMKQLGKFEFVRLLTIASHKSYDINSPVSIIHHPNGGEKKAALHNSTILIGNKETKKDAIFYSADTSYGSSGAPVFDKNWMCIGLHRNFAPKRSKEGYLISKNGSIFQVKSENLKSVASVPEDRIDELAVLANVGTKSANISTKIKTIITHNQDNETYAEDCKKLLEITTNWY